MAQTASTFANTLTTLQEHQATHSLSILALAEPIIASTSQPTISATFTDHPATNQQPCSTHPSSSSSSSSNHPVPNDSIVDTSSETHLTPFLLSADLEHYTSLFAKLRFSYLEQVTKEKYLRSIVGDPPILVSHADNVRLEDELLDMKRELKGKKEEVLVGLVGELRELAGKLGSQVEWEREGMVEVERLVRAVEELEEREERLLRVLRERRLVWDGDGERESESEEDPRMNLGLGQMRGLVQERLMQIEEMDRQIAELQNALPEKMRECEVVEKELAGLERTRDESARAAGEARRVKERGGRDRVEELGRWYRAAEVVMKGLGLDAKDDVVGVER